MASRIPRVAAMLLVLSLVARMHAQSILTIAGGGSDDGQLGTDVHAYVPRGLALDKSNNLYFVEQAAGRVRRLDTATGRVTAIAGVGASGFSGDGGLATGATLNVPQQIALDADGNLFITDRGNDRIRRVDAKSGIITTFAGGGTLPEGQIGDGGAAKDAVLFQPWGILINGGYLWFTEIAYNGHRIRRINLQTNVIETIAGAVDSGDDGDGGPARNAHLNTPLGLAADSAGNIYVADGAANRVRKIDNNLTITAYAGNGQTGRVGDGGAATAAQLEFPAVLAFDPAGNLVIGTIGALRRVDRATNIISTFAEPFGLILGLAIDGAGNAYIEDDSNGVIVKRTAGSGVLTTIIGGGSYIGDGLVAPAAILAGPLGLAVNKRGDIFIADSANTVVRKIDAATQVIRTVAGMVGAFYAGDQEGNDATNAAIGGVTDVALDSAENLYIADGHNNRIWRVDANGKITTYAGGGTPNIAPPDGPAIGSYFVPLAIVFDKDDNLYIADSDSHRVRRVDAKTKVITTYAGSSQGSGGDGGQATAAKLDTPRGLAVDRSGNVFVSDANGVIRRIDAQTHVITRIAGGGSPQDGIGDGGSALSASMDPVHLAIHPTTGDLYLSDQSLHRVRKIDSRTQTISTVAGSATFYLFGDFAGDNGPATSAKLNFGYNLSGLAFNGAGDLFISDTSNNRVRGVLACRTIDAPALTAPANNATNVPESPTLTWTRPSGAFRFDVYLDTANPPARLVAEDVTDASFSISNLKETTRYFWRVVAKGDQYCSPRATSTSPTFSFTTTGETCAIGSFDTTAPANGATGVVDPVTLSWQAATGAATYDLYLGSVNPPPLFSAGLTTTSTVAHVSGTAFWYVVAHAACDAAKTSQTAVRSFTVAKTCLPNSIPTVTLDSPANGATNVAVPVTLNWTSSTAATYDLFFGTTNPPPLVNSGLSINRATISELTPGATYFWRVAASNECGGSVSATASFTVRACSVPSAPSFTFTPPSVTSGSTYTVVWSAAPGIDAGGGYLVERSSSATFVTIIDAQVTQSTAAAFVAGAPGTIYHRVRGVPACDPSHPGAVSGIRSVTVTEAPPNVIFTVQPAAVITSLGERIEDRRGRFTLENISNTALQVIIGRQELGGSPPFFSIVDPSGRDAAFVTLQPHVPHAFELRYAGPRNDVALSYEGVVFVAATGKPLSVTPYAFVNLKVGGAAAARPEFRLNGSPTDYAAFSAFDAAGDDAQRTPLTITIANNGTTPMELAAEIGPEVWLATEDGWNDTPLPAGASRAVKLNTRRGRAPNGSALPRYTYFTVRTKDGASARLLVQDNDTLTVSNGRGTRLAADDPSLIVPEVVSRLSPRGTTVVSRLWITNIGGDAVRAELTFTPERTDGFLAASVRRATVVVPPNDVATLTDPLVQIFGLSRPVRGQLEVRLPRERIGFVSVTSSIVALGAGTAYTMPIVARGDGARAGSPQTLLGVTKGGSATTALTLVETTGVDEASVTATLFDASGARIGAISSNVPRYGFIRFDDLVAAANAQNVDGGRVVIALDGSSGASVVALGTVSDSTGERGAVQLSIDFSRPVTLPLAMRMLHPDDTTPIGVTTVVPVLPANVAPTSPQKTEVVFSAPTGLGSTFTALFHLANGSQSGTTRTIPVPGGASIVFHDVLADLFGLGVPVPGSLAVNATNNGKISAVLKKSGGLASTVIPLPTSASDLLTGATLLSQRPLFYDGLEQSIDPTRGSRWLLVLNEVGGASGTASIRLYEAGNRTTPIAQQDVIVGANQQLTLDTVFASLGLDAADRKKDRTNVQVVVIASSGSARIAATAVSVDNATGDTQAHALTPGAALPSTTVVTPVLPTAETTTRRRAAGH
jgi:sugar lactone lactonase YvrE